MKYRHIETMREIRLWIGQIIVPAATVLGTIAITRPDLIDKIKVNIKKPKKKED